MAVSVLFKVEKFEGPLDLLLQLVEKNELDISEVSLAAVAEQFVSHVNDNPEIPLEELADFLVIAAKLMYLKSKLLLPDLSAPELEDGPSLEDQLKRYRRFVELSRVIEGMWDAGAMAYPRSRVARPREVSFSPPADLTVHLLADLMRRVIAKLEPLVKLPQASMERVVSIQEMIGSLFQRIRHKSALSFRSFVGNRASKGHVIVSFLALLELVKQRFVRVGQQDAFHDIHIETHPEAPADDPLAHSYV